MTAVDVVKVPPLISVLVISLILGASVVASLMASRREALARAVVGA